MIQKKSQKGYSAGISGKTKATAHVADLYKNDKLDYAVQGDISFFVYFKDWWVDGKCPYQREQLRGGSSIGLEHMASGRSIMIRYLMPAFGKRKVSSLTTPMISEWRYSLVEKHGLGNRTANSSMTYLRDMMDFAWGHNVIPEKPCLRIKALRDNCVQRGVLSRSEASRLLSDTTLWDNRLAYIANYTAALTGMRISEIIVLQGENIFPTALSFRRT
jgi:hypothetical protein